MEVREWDGPAEEKFGVTAIAGTRGQKGIAKGPSRKQSASRETAMGEREESGGMSVHRDLQVVSGGISDRETGR